MTIPNDIARGRPTCLRDDAVSILKRLRDSGHVAYFAGGCVRDLLMRIEPKDFDLATDAPPQRVRELFPGAQMVGAAFGVVLVRHGRSVVEVATFRSDGEYHDGRHPASVRFTTAEEDARRRDFTINGLFLDPISGEVVDYVGGQADVESRTLRAIGDPGARFAEDHLRLLRAVRFAARFDLAIDAATAKAIAAETPMLKRITPERIADELRLMLPAPTRFATWLLLWRFGLLGVIFRHVAEAPAIAAMPERSLFLATAPGMPISFPLAMLSAAISYQRTFADPTTDVRRWLAPGEIKRLIRALRQGLKLSNAESDAIEQIAAGVMMMLHDDPPPLARRKRMLAMVTSYASIALLRAIAAIGQHVDRVAMVAGQLQELHGVEVSPTPLLSGDDLIAMGMQAGPAFKHILEAVYDLQLEGTIANPQEANDAARQIGRT